jgi:hypothetical protein
MVPVSEEFKLIMREYECVDLTAMIIYLIDAFDSN